MVSMILNGANFLFLFGEVVVDFLHEIVGELLHFLFAVGEVVLRDVAGFLLGFQLVDGIAAHVPDGDAAACVERAEALAATFDAYTAAETPWRLAAALDTAGPRPADPVEFAIWCAAISRPPLPLGSGFDVRPSILEALDGVSRLVIAEHGLRRALAERQGDDVTAFGEPPRLPEYVRADLSS